METSDCIEKARRVIALEIQELERLRERLGDDFAKAVAELRRTLDERGKIVVVGVGKSGNIGHKIAATLNSTGATAVVLNSQNALHGDLGMVSPGDAVIALSQKGETREVLELLPHLRRRAGLVIAFTGAGNSTLARHSDIVLDVNVEREACPLNLAPTSSSTVMLVLGDALAMTLLDARGFTRDDFASLHPGGSIGRGLLTKVADIMRGADQLALVKPETPVREALAAMSRARAGAAVAVRPDRKLAGIFTQGDFARAFQKTPDLGSRPVAEFMTRSPVTIRDSKLAVEVLNLFESHAIDDLVVVDADGRVIGIVDAQDLSRRHVL